jgi:hypothetical protein
MIRGPISLLIVGSVALVGVALVTLGPRAFQDYLPEPVIAALDSVQTMSGMGNTGGSSGGGAPADFLSDASNGLDATGPIAAREGNQPVFIKDVVTGYKTRISADMPLEITTIRPITGCRLTAPEADAAVGHVTAGSNDMDLALSTYNDTHLADAVQVFVNTYRTGAVTQAEAVSAPSFRAYDVAVTETRKPVYLVLENTYGDLIWNIHLAPGARIERVVLLGGNHAGVANVDPVVPVEVLPGPAMADCGIRPAYGLNAGHLFFQSLANGAMSKTEAEEKLATLSEAIAAYDVWFRDTFGILASASRAGFDQGTISVVGPVPGEADPKATYAPIKGSRVRATHDIYFEVRGQVAKGEDFAGRVKAIATTFAYGDLANLRQGVEF